MFVDLQEALVDRLNNTSFTHSPSIYVEVPSDPSFPYITINDLSDNAIYTDDNEYREAQVAFAVVERWNTGEVSDKEFKEIIGDLEDGFKTKLTPANYEITSQDHRDNTNIIQEVDEERGTTTKRGIVQYEYILKKT